MSKSEQKYNELPKKHFILTNNKKRGISIILTVVSLLVLLYETKEIIELFDYFTLISADKGDNYLPSLSGYWSTIIGGIISGFISIVGVMLTIGYYRAADEDNAINQMKPFLYVEFFDVDFDYSYQFDNNDDDDSKLVSKTLKITNIGNSYTKTISIRITDFKDDIELDYLLPINESFYLPISFHDFDKEGVIFMLDFVDSLTNLYYQEYEIYKNIHGELLIRNGFPVMTVNHLKMQ